MQTSAYIHLRVYLQNITLLLVASHSEQKLIAVFTHSLFHHPQLWHSIYPLPFFRQRNLRWPFCLRCLHEIHCKSVRNLRPQYAPVIVICPVSVTIICSHALRPTDTYSIPFISIVGVCNWLSTIDTHDSWNITRTLHPSSSAPWTQSAATFFSVQASSNYPLWIRIRQEYYFSFQMCHWCSLKIPITRSCQRPKASSNQ